MASDLCVRRLTKELKALQKDKDLYVDPKITVAPNESNILEMHYVIEGGPSTPYEGGVYHGKLLFPKEYPLKPPGVMMMTPSGRFQPNRRLCLSMSDFHPESWNPMWSVATIITGLYSFMIESNPTLGSVETTPLKKRQLAASSLEYNVTHNKDFVKLFPEYVERYEKEKLLRQQQQQADAQNQSGGDRTKVSGSTAALLAGDGGEDMPLGAALAWIVALLSLIVVLSRFLF